MRRDVQILCALQFINLATCPALLSAFFLVSPALPSIHLFAIPLASPQDSAPARHVSPGDGSPSSPHSPGARRIATASRIAAFIGCVALLGALCLLAPRRTALETRADDAVEISSSRSAAVRFFAFGDWGRNGTFNQSLIAQQVRRTPFLIVLHAVTTRHPHTPSLLCNAPIFPSTLCGGDGCSGATNGPSVCGVGGGQLL
ncbi:unnamed protein product [Closterium sp. Yama58-4]|nr:unnamed protein product [Closterium sp. Yama58-4]CAI5480578.1 unnamed protein product [Closterium sp. Yama58-4]CAI5480583.1 unnamed protein product [Closterium sp. Yama58-4]